MFGHSFYTGKKRLFFSVYYIKLQLSFFYGLFVLSFKTTVTPLLLSDSTKRPFSLWKWFYNEQELCKNSNIFPNTPSK